MGEDGLGEEQERTVEGGGAAGTRWDGEARDKQGQTLGSALGRESGTRPQLRVSHRHSTSSLILLTPGVRLLLVAAAVLLATDDDDGAVVFRLLTRSTP